MGELAEAVAALERRIDELDEFDQYAADDIQDVFDRLHELDGRGTSAAPDTE
jgi:hypothetical protein